MIADIKININNDRATSLFYRKKQKTSKVDCIVGGLYQTIWLGQ